MEHSRAYISFVNQINGTGRQKLDGYNPKLLDEIFEWERGETENVICRNIDVLFLKYCLKKNKGWFLVSNRLKMLLETVNTDIQFLEVKIKEKIMKRTLINIMVDPQKIVTKEKIRNED